MTKKAFKVGNRVVGKTKKYLNKHGQVIAVCVGAKGTLTRVRWSSGQVDEVTCYAIDVASSQQATRQSIVRASVEEDYENNEENEWECSSSDSHSCSSSQPSVSIFAIIFSLFPDYIISCYFWISRIIYAMTRIWTAATWMRVILTPP